ncbi:MAG: hypothetical protein ACE5KL_07785, partial [Alphaproteobacteria bacterium]
LRREFRSIDPAAARILLVEGGERVLHTFPAKLSDKAARSLSRLGVPDPLRELARAKLRLVKEVAPHAA